MAYWLAGGKAAAVTRESGEGSSVISGTRGKVMAVTCTRARTEKTPKSLLSV